MGTNHHIQPMFTMDTNAVIESTRGLVSFYDPLSSLVDDSSLWYRLADYCNNLVHYPLVMSALSRLHANSIIDFEKGLFCGLLSVLVGEQLKLDPSRVRALYYAGLTQDVGAYMDDLRVADYFSPGQERVKPKMYGVSGLDRKRSHALVSYSLLEEAFPDDPLVAELVLHHHASEDGTGYPSNVGEAQLNSEMQILIVANELCEILHQKGGFDELFSCRASLKLASTMYFKTVNGAFYSLFQKAAQRSSLDSAIPVDERRLRLQVEALRDFSEGAVALSAELIKFDHFSASRLFRAKVRKLDLLMGETGLLFSSDDTCQHEAAHCMEALPEFLLPLSSVLNDVTRLLPIQQKKSCGELKAKLKHLLSLLHKPKAFSLFV